MITEIITTAAFLIAIEGILIAFFNKDVKKFMAELSKKKNADKIIRNIGLWEILIGFVLLILAIVLRWM
jgi:uncharacterized protein YjeT (DUF2065 family)